MHLFLLLAHNAANPGHAFALPPRRAIVMGSELARRGYEGRVVTLDEPRTSSEPHRPMAFVSIVAGDEIDAMAWALTTLPPSQITWRGVRRLRRAGVQEDGRHWAVLRRLDRP